MSELSIGIDFGTTKTLVSFYNETTGKPETIRLGRGRDYMPTSVYASEEGCFYSEKTLMIRSNSE